MGFPDSYIALGSCIYRISELSHVHFMEATHLKTKSWEDCWTEARTVQVELKAKSLRGIIYIHSPALDENISLQQTHTCSHTVYAKDQKSINPQTSSGTWVVQLKIDTVRFGTQHVSICRHKEAEEKKNRAHRRKCKGYNFPQSVSAWNKQLGRMCRASPVCVRVSMFASTFHLLLYCRSVLWLGWVV